VGTESKIFSNIAHNQKNVK
jgi:hypothetical protein